MQISFVHVEYKAIYNSPREPYNLLALFIWRAPFSNNSIYLKESLGIYKENTKFLIYFNYVFLILIIFMPHNMINNLYHYIIH